MYSRSAASFAYFSTYELLKKKFTHEGATGPTVFGTLMAGGLAGWANWMLCLPFDTLKTRLQVAPEGANTLNVYAYIYMRKEYGIGFGGVERSRTIGRWD